MTLVTMPPIRDHHERCSNCDQWAQHAVSIQRRPATDEREGNATLGSYRSVRCLACGATDVGRLDDGRST